MKNSDENKKTCPYCSEPILSTAKKCRYCGEWLESPTERTGGDSGLRGTSNAIAVSKGLKEKEYQDSAIGCGGVLVLAIAIFVGIKISSAFDSSLIGWIVGILIFGIGAIKLGNRYWKE
ncbi:MAG: hypothetical protein JG782_829 [Anaerophaga sp.]|nr:hypothetical protein [Anaerophaga sp.]